MEESRSWLADINPHPRIVGSTDGQRAYVDPRRVIYDHELMLFGAGGHFILECDADLRYEFHGPSYVIIPPGLWHTCRGIRSEQVTRAWVHFDWTYDNRPVAEKDITYAPAEPLTELYHRAPSFVPRDLIYGELKNPPQIDALHQALDKRFQSNDPIIRHSARAALLELLIYVLDDGTQQTLPSAQQREASPFTAFAIRDALHEYAHQAFNACPPLKQFLQDRGQSYDHQARLFKRAFGVSPLQYVNSLRIESAAHLIRGTDTPIGQVAEHLGYDDPVYFARCFKKYMGLSPSALRRARAVM